MDLSELLNHAEDAFLIPCRNDGGRVDLFARNFGGDTVLHVAVGRRRADEVRFLVGQGLDVNARGEFEATPLFCAADNGDFAMVRCLVELGADSMIPDHLGVLPERALFRHVMTKGEGGSQVNHNS